MHVEELYGVQNNVLLLERHRQHELGCSCFEASSTNPTYGVGGKLFCLLYTHTLKICIIRCVEEESIIIYARCNNLRPLEADEAITLLVPSLTQHIRSPLEAASQGWQGTPLFL